MRINIKFIKSFKIAVAALAAVVAAFAIAWIIAPYVVSDPMEELEKRTQVRVYRDSRGEVAHVERTWEYQWRFDTPLEDVSTNVLRIMLTTEDARFYSHHGVDYLAMARAAWQDITSFRIVSGSSTITMQLAGLADERKSRTLRWKFKQAARARLLERKYTKDRILREYLNHIPMGGQIYGIEAASRYYFGRPASDLNLSEAALLCGLPQSPARLRPDRHRDAALRRMEIVLQLLERRGGISHEEAERVRREEKLRFRDFERPFDLRELEMGGTEQFFWALARREAGGDKAPSEIATTLDPTLQAQVLEILRVRRGALDNVRDGAAIVLDNHTGAILAYVGTLDYSGQPDGQVDAVTATRGAGSSLKPFIYAEAVEGGLIVGDSMMLDAPTRYGDYMPANYDGTFAGFVAAKDALSHSLNTPAVRLLAVLGEKRMMACMDKIGLISTAGVKWNGLALALGSAGHTLADIAGAYACLAREGETISMHALAGCEPGPGHRIFSQGASAMVSRMIRTPLPGTTVDCAWKTGTSHSNHDAWCFAYTPDHTVGVWMGNKDGKPSPSLVGAIAAVPAVSAILNRLYAGGRPSQWPNENERFEIVELCKRSGLRKGADCAEGFNGYAPRGIPLRQCELCSGERTFSSFRIITPLPGTYRANPDGVARLTLDAEAPAYWFDNNAPIGHHDESWEYDAPAGRHVILASPDSGEPPSSIVITVTDRLAKSGESQME